MRKYDDEFKREAVRKVDGQSVASVARELGIPRVLGALQELRAMGTKYETATILQPPWKNGTFAD